MIVEPPERITIYTPVRSLRLARFMLHRRPEFQLATYWLPPNSWIPCAKDRAEKQPGWHLWRRWRWRAVR